MSVLPAVLRRLAVDAPVDIDTADYLQTTADRLEQCEQDARAVLDALAAAELELADQYARQRANTPDQAAASAPFEPTPRNAPGGQRSD